MSALSVPDRRRDWFFVRRFFFIHRRRSLRKWRLKGTRQDSWLSRPIVESSSPTVFLPVCSITERLWVHARNLSLDPELGLEVYPIWFFLGLPWWIRWNPWSPVSEEWVRRDAWSPVREEWVRWDTWSPVREEWYPAREEWVRRNSWYPVREEWSPVMEEWVRRNAWYPVREVVLG
jgi:hypothetical protein